MAARGAMPIVRQPKSDDKPEPHGTFQIGLLTFGLIALLIYLPSRVQAAAEQRVKIGFATISPVVAPLWVAADRGFFAQEGLDAELVFIGSAPTLVASLIAREVPFASTAGTAVMSAVAGGAPPKILATINNRSTSDLVARAGHSAPHGLRGKLGGVPRTCGRGF